MAELDHIAVAVLPIVEEGEIGANGLDRSQQTALGLRGSTRIITVSRRRGLPSSPKRWARLRAAAAQSLVEGRA
jgi:hypothetical protein